MLWESWSNLESAGSSRARSAVVHTASSAAAIPDRQDRGHLRQGTVSRSTSSRRSRCSTPRAGSAALPLLRRNLLSGGGLAQPVVETGLTEHRVFFGDERPFSQYRAGVEGLRIGHYLARVVQRAEETSDQSVKAKLLGAADFDHAVDRSTHGDPPYGRGDIVRRHGLEQHWCQADAIAVGRGVRDALDELEELRRVNDRVWDRRSLDQRFLRDFRSEVPALPQALGAHDR